MGTMRKTTRGRSLGELTTALVLALFAIMLLAGTALAAAPTAPKGTVTRPRGESSAAQLVRWLPNHAAPAALTLSGASRAARSPASLLRTTPSGPCNVTGHVYQGYPQGSPVAWLGGGVVVGYYDADGSWFPYPAVTTAGDGSYAVSSVAETTEGEIDAYPSGSDDSFWSWGHTFTAAGPNVVDIQPGAIGVVVNRSSDSNWNGWSLPYVQTVGTNGGAGSYVADGSPMIANAMPADCQYAVIDTWANEWTELPISTPLTVSPGQLNPATITADEADFQRIWVKKPTFASGKPGSTCAVALQNFTPGWSVGLYGYGIAPRAAARDWPVSPVPTGTTGTYTRTVTIPSTAQPGYAYDLHAYRNDTISSVVGTSWLDLSYGFQVCTLKSSPSRVRPNVWYTLSGVIPTEGHWGSHPGKSKYVTLYWSTKKRPQPTVWNPTKQGWHFGFRKKANRFGKYVFHALLEPGDRTTYQVVRYAGDNEYNGGFTSVVKTTLVR